MRKFEASKKQGGVERGGVGSNIPGALYVVQSLNRGILPRMLVERAS